MNKLKKIIHTAHPTELYALKKDLETGTLHALLNQQIQKHADTQTKHCPVCGLDVKPSSSLQLTFGPPDLRKQAHFDAIDCLEHFIVNNLKKERSLIRDT